MRQLDFKLGTLPIIAATLALCGLLTACAEPDPIQQVTETRAQYVVELNGFVPQVAAEPEIDPLAEEPIGDAPDVTEGEGGEGEEGASDAADLEPSSTDVLFDFVIYFKGKESLSGVTVEIVHVDPFEQEKQVFLEWLDTSGIVKSETRQLSVVRPVENFIEGDKFAAVLKSHVPDDEMSAYREYQ